MSSRSEFGRPVVSLAAYDAGIEALFVSESLTLRTSSHPEGVGPRMATLRAEMKVLRAEWAKSFKRKLLPGTEKWSGWEPRHGRLKMQPAPSLMPRLA